MIPDPSDRLAINFYQSSNNIIKIIAIHYLKNQLQESLLNSINNDQLDKLVVQLIKNTCS